MSLELHIWGPAFGLSSIDPDCLAAVAYFSAAVPRGDWTLVATSPSALPRTLPALRDARTRKWVAAGFGPIVAYLRAQSVADLDAGLTASQAADVTAFSAFLHAEAAPLLGLSLYVSSANWAATTRPAYGGILPFPLTWIEPPAVRASHVAGAAHLGLSSLQTDEDVSSSSSAAGSGFSSLSAAFHAFPDRMRATEHNDGGAQAAADVAHPPPPPSIPLHPASQTVSSALTPEAKAQIRLDEAARTCLAVLAKRKGSKRTLLRADGSGGGEDGSHADGGKLEPSSGGRPPLRPTSLDCLAFGYLALMATPDVPRPFLRDAMRRHYRGLLVYVADMWQACFGSHDRGTRPPASSLAQSSSQTPPPPSTPPPPLQHLYPLWLRSVHGIVHSVPGLSGEWLVWLWRQIRVADDDDDDDRKTSRWQQDVVAARRQRIVTLFATVAGTALAVGLVFGYRRLPNFGLPVVVYRRASRPLVGMGAAGALLATL